jgi:hypothetical protein
MQHPALDRDLDPYDRLLAAIIRQAMTDYKHHTEEYDEARAFLLDMGLLDDAGDVCTVALLWDVRRSIPLNRAV